MLRFSFKAVVTQVSATSTGRPCSALLLKQVANHSTLAATEAEQDSQWISARPFDDMPGPKPLPLIGNSGRFLPFIGEYAISLDELVPKLYKQFGDMVKVSGKFGAPDTVYIFNPHVIEQALRNEGKWPTRDATASFAYYRNVTRKDIFQGVGGLIVTQGEEWQKFRTKVNPALMQPRNAKLYVSRIDEVAKEFLIRMNRIKDKNEEMPPDFQNELAKWALESVGLVALDKRLGCFKDYLEPGSEQQRMINAVIDVIECMYKLDMELSFWKFFNTPTWNKFVKSMDCFTEVAIKYVKEAMDRVRSRSQDEYDDLSILERLLLNEPDPKVAFVTSLDLLFGGIDTTANAVAILLYQLAKNPDKQEKLYQEIKRFIPNADDPLTPENLEEMKYLRACVKESMRMKPVTFGNMRKLNKDTVLGNYAVPKGTALFFMQGFLCSLEKYYPEPDKFIPERWMKGQDGEIAEARKAHPFIYMPFGFGTRMCLGKRFAEYEIFILTTRIVRNFRVEYNYGEMKFKQHLILKCARPLQYKMIQRN